MSWANEFKRLSTPLALAAAMVCVPAHAGVVIASSGPSSGSFPPGKKLADDATITLKVADSVTILDAKGTRVLRGVGTFTVGAGNGTVSRASTFAALTQQRSAQRVRTGAVRGSATAQMSPNLWYVDLTRSGTFCVTDPAAVRVWRPVKDGTASYAIQDGKHASTASLDFADGVTVAPWNAVAAPVADRASYTIAAASGNSATSAAKVTFAVLPAQDYAPEDLVVALMAKGCTAQVDLLAASTALPDK